MIWESPKNVKKLTIKRKILLAGIEECRARIYVAFRLFLNICNNHCCFQLIFYYC